MAERSEVGKTSNLQTAETKWLRNELHNCTAAQLSPILHPRVGVYI